LSRPRPSRNPFFHVGLHRPRSGRGNEGVPRRIGGSRGEHPPMPWFPLRGPRRRSSRRTCTRSIAKAVLRPSSSSSQSQATPLAANGVSFITLAFWTDRAGHELTRPSTPTAGRGAATVASNRHGPQALHAFTSPRTTSMSSCSTHRGPPPNTPNLLAKPNALDDNEPDRTHNDQPATRRPNWSTQTVRTSPKWRHPREAYRGSDCSHETSPIRAARTITALGTTTTRMRSSRPGTIANALRFREPPTPPPALRDRPSLRRTIYDPRHPRSGLGLASDRELARLPDPASSPTPEASLVAPALRGFLTR